MFNLDSLTWVSISSPDFITPEVESFFFPQILGSQTTKSGGIFRISFRFVRFFATPPQKNALTVTDLGDFWDDHLIFSHFYPQVVA